MAASFTTGRDIRDATNGAEFGLITVHLARGNAKFRAEQAVGLREWASNLRIPLFAIGDFNFDYEFANGKGNEAFDAFQDKITRSTVGKREYESTTAQGSPARLSFSAWDWVKPDELVDTNWDDRDGDGLDNYPGSCLDFTFACRCDELKMRSRVIVRDGDFPDDQMTSDHRPLELVIE